MNHKVWTMTQMIYKSIFYAAAAVSEQSAIWESAFGEVEIWKNLIYFCWLEVWSQK